MKVGEKALDKHPQNVRKLLIAYIGDMLSPVDRETFERRLLDDEVFSSEVEAEEFSLKEEYSDGSLPDDETAIVTAWIESSPALKMQVEITSALRRRVVAAPPKRKTLHVLSWGLAIAAGLALVAMLPVWRHKDLPEPPSSQNAQLSAAKPALPEHENIILLQAERLRGSADDHQGISVHSINPSAGTRLQIIVPQTMADDLFSVDLRSSSRESSFTAVHVAKLPVKTKGSVRYIELAVGPHEFTPGSYAMTLQAESGKYSLQFTITNSE